MTLNNSHPKSFRIAIVLILAGAFISGLLVMEHYNQIHESALLSMMCGDSPTSGCNAVNRSEYSSVVGIPVAAFGLWFYLTLTMILSLASFGSPSIKDAAGRLCFLALCAALAADIGLFAVQFFLLKTFCTLCLTTYGVTLLSMYFLREYRKKGSGETLRGFNQMSEGRMLIAAWSSGTILLLVAVSAGSLLLAYRDPDKLQERFQDAALQEFLQSPEQKFNLEGTPVQGASDAKIKIVIFSDFLCPWCRQVAQSFQQHMPRWKDRVAIYYKSYPLDQFCNPYEKSTAHPGACWAVLGGVCAGAQGKFWDFHDRIFTLPPRNPGSDAIVKIGAEAGLDTAALSACMHDGTMQRKVRGELTEAHDAGIDGTPRIFINGRKLPKLNYLSAILASEAKRLGVPPLEGLGD